MEAKELWSLIDQIDCKNTEIEIWLSTLSLLSESMESAAQCMPGLSHYMNTLFLALNGITTAKNEQREVIDQAFKMVESKRTNPIHPPAAHTAHIS